MSFMQNHKPSGGILQSEVADEEVDFNHGKLIRQETSEQWSDEDGDDQFNSYNPIVSKLGGEKF